MEGSFPGICTPQNALERETLLQEFFNNWESEGERTTGSPFPPLPELLEWCQGYSRKMVEGTGAPLQFPPSDASLGCQKPQVNLRAALKFQELQQLPLITSRGSLEPMWPVQNTYRDLG